MKKYVVYVVIMALLISIAGCSGKGESHEKSSYEKDEIVLALSNEPESGFDPILGYGSYGSPLIQSTLLALNEDLDITYDLAEEYQVSDDKLVWEFKLRDDVVFSDGKRVTAKDVAFTYKEAKKSGSTVDLSELQDIKLVDDYTVQFILKKPQSTFVYTAASLGIVPEHIYSGQYGSQPVGSGPYRLVQWDKGQQAIFMRNDDYYRGKPFFKKVTVLFMNEDAAYAAAKSGQVDVAQTSSAYINEEMDNMQIKDFDSVDNRGISFVTIPAGAKVNNKEAGNDVTSDIAIRQAINLAINREEIVHDALNGYGKPAYSNADDLPWGSEKTVVKHNVEKAREILAVAGWNDQDDDGILEKGKLKASFNLIYLAGDSTRQAISMAVKQQLADLGIQVKVAGGSWDDIANKMYKDAVLFGWGNRNPIEANYLYHSSNIGIDWYNANSYSSDKVDAVIEDAMVTGDYKEWQKVQELVAADAPWAWLVNVDHLYFVRKGLNVGKQPIHPHDHALVVLNNIQDWKWED